MFITLGAHRRAKSGGYQPRGITHGSPGTAQNASDGLSQKSIHVGHAKDTTPIIKLVTREPVGRMPQNAYDTDDTDKFQVERNSPADGDVPPETQGYGNRQTTKCDGCHDREGRHGRMTEDGKAVELCGPCRRKFDRGELQL